MKEVITYLSFDGNCKEAMTFYAKCMGAELFLHPYSAGPMDIPADAKDRIMHATLTKGAPILMASDTPPGMATKQGNNFSISVTCESLEEVERLFTAIGEKGIIKMPLQDTFWGAHFGMLTDRFGINWMFNFELPK
jgi:Uncharacterized protein conserved in bacteria